MQSRHAFLLTIFEKLGTPLLSAVAEVAERERLASGGKAGLGAAQDAEQVAALLKAATEMSLTFSHQLDLRTLDDTQADGVRLTLASLAAPLVANFFRLAGRVPGTAEIDRLAGALQPVTLYADNYNAAADANARLQTLDQDFAPLDAPQVQMNLLHALLPIVNAIATFPFGRSEKDLMQEVMERLTTKARDLRTSLFGNLPTVQATRAELALLRAAALVYSQTHFTEMSKLMFMSEQQRDQVDLNVQLRELWVQVDRRLAMLQVLAETLVTGRSTVSEGAVAPKASPFQKPVSSPPPFSDPEEGAATVVSPPAPPAGQKGNPMSFFTKPKTETGTGAQ